MGFFDGIHASEKTLRVRHNVWGWVWGMLVAGAGLAVGTEVVDETLPWISGFLEPLGDHRGEVGLGLIAVGLVMALWRKTVVFQRDGRVTVERHLLFLPMRRTYPRAEIRAIGTGADTTGVTWYSRYSWHAHRAETTTYIGHVMFRDGSWTEMFRCKGHGDFQRRIETILEFTGLPVRRN